MRRYGLRDDQWERIRDLLPGRAGSVGVTARDNRLFVEGVLYRYRAGLPWRDLPERFGDGVQVHRRAAIEQLQLAQTSADGDFYDHSVVDARLKELRAELALEQKDARKR